jgi:hypothetical protein
MTRLKMTVLLMAASVVAISAQTKPTAVDQSELAGTWTINRALSQFPREVGFGMDVVPPSRSGSGDLAGVEGDVRSGNPRSLTAKPQTEDVARNTQQLVNEVKSPPGRLTIVQTAAAVTVTDDRGRSRTFHPDGREEFPPLDGGPISTTARWEGARLVVRYKVESGREVRYSYSRKADPPQLVVQAEFLERGGHDTVIRVYEPATAAAAPPANDPAAPDRTAPPVLPPTPPVLPSLRDAARQGPPGGVDPGKTLVPAASDRATPANLDQRPDAELIGLTALGVVVEGVGPEAEKCGLKQDVVEAAVSRSLSGAGLRVALNTDEDSYLYVHVMTAAVSTGFCTSRYDASVYTHVAATLSYGSRPVLVQVSLLHKGGITGSGASSHGEAVVRALTQYVDQFAARIRGANK